MPRGIRWLFLADTLLGLLALAAFAYSAQFDVEKIELLRLGSESNLPTWFSSSQLLLIGLVLSALALRDVRLDRPASLLILSAPLLFIALSIDEAAMLHERIGALFEDYTGVGVHLATGPWVLVAVPVFLCGLSLAAYATRSYWYGRNSVCLLFGLGATLFLLSAVGLEFAGNFFVGEANLHGEGTLAQKLLGFAEELGEMIAATFMLWGALELIREEGIYLNLGPQNRSPTEPS